MPSWLTSLHYFAALREVHNKIRAEVNRLTGENTRLTASNDDLEIQVEKVSGLEDKLSDIVKSQGHDIKIFVQAVKENGKIIDKIKASLE